MNLFQCEPNVRRLQVPIEYYDYLTKNKEQFDNITLEEVIDPERSRGGLSNEKYVMRRLKVREFRRYSAFTDDDEEYIQVVLEKYNEGVIPKNTTKRIKRQIEEEKEPLKILSILKREIPTRLLGVRQVGHTGFVSQREVILSEWLEGENS